MTLTFQQLTGRRGGHREILVDGQSIRVGRTEWADFAVPDDPRISSVHFELRWDGHQAVIRDLNSSNGTRVNGQPVTEHVLSSGDLLVAGETQFTVEFAVPQPSASDQRATVRGTIVNPTKATVTMNETVNLGFPGGTSVRAAALIDDSRRPYSVGLADPDPTVRQAALHAAAWSRQPWLLGYCRKTAEKPHPAQDAELWLFCVLAEPSDLDRILRLAQVVELGARRYQLLGTYGHPGVLPELLRAMRAPALPTKVAAGKAFQQITGVDIESGERVVLEPDRGEQETEDSLEREFLDPEPLPDVERATEYWQSARQPFDSVTRLRHGRDISRFPSPEVLVQFDLASRREICMRGNYEGTWNGGPRTGLRYLVSPPSHGRGS